MTTTQQHVEAFMTEHGFTWYEHGWCWAKLDNPEDEVSPETSFTNKQATFMWRLMVKTQRDTLQRISAGAGEWHGTEYCVPLSHITQDIAELDQLLGENN